MAEWNDPADIKLVSRTFDDWAEPVIAKDRPRVESFHDDGFRVRLGERLYGKDEHVAIELSVAVREMSIIEIEATRRIGNILLVWSKHLIKADHVPELPPARPQGRLGRCACRRAGLRAVRVHRVAPGRRQAQMPGIRGASLTLFWRVLRNSSTRPAMRDGTWPRAQHPPGLSAS
jgi:hypothetical protein